MVCYVHHSWSPTSTTTFISVIDPRLQGHVGAILTNIVPHCGNEIDVTLAIVSTAEHDRRCHTSFPIVGASHTLEAVPRYLSGTSHWWRRNWYQRSADLNRAILRTRRGDIPVIIQSNGHLDDGVKYKYSIVTIPRSLGGGNWRCTEMITIQTVTLDCMSMCPKKLAIRVVMIQVKGVSCWVRPCPSWLTLSELLSTWALLSRANRIYTRVM
jgi:hypothetical protein